MNMAKNDSAWLSAVFWVLLAATMAQPARSATTEQALGGEVQDPKGAAIQGAVCTLTGPLLTGGGLPETTGADGRFDFTGLLPGTYSLTCAAVGRQPVAKPGITIGTEPPPFLEVILPPEVILHETINVLGHSRQVSAQHAGEPSRIVAHQLESLPLVEEKFTAALPLVPGVVRTPDGKISIKGSSLNQGMLLVDSAEAVDPVTGSFSISVPIDAIESLRVYKSAYLTQYGQFSGGLTTIHIKAPPEAWKFELNDMIPSPRIRSGHMVGIEDDEPRLSFGGPLIANKFNFAEYFVYDYEREPVRGLAWPNNETDTQGFTSLTDFQYISSAHHLDNVEVTLFPLRRQFMNINALMPQSASSNYGQRGYSVALSDHYLFKSGIVLSTVAKQMRFVSDAYGQGAENMLWTPNGFGGNYFNAWNRTSSQQEFSQVFALPTKHAWGAHHFSFGEDVIRRSYHGGSHSHPVILQDLNGTPAEQITFEGPGLLAARDTETALFVEDHWAFDPHVALDAGARASSQTLGERATIAPRVGLVYSPGPSGRTIFRSGFGVFDDRIPLLAGGFTNNPARVITLYNNGVPTGPPIVYQNAYEHFNEDGLLVPTGHHLGSTPYNLTWSAEVDQEVSRDLVLRVSYLGSHTYDEFMISPKTVPNGQSLMLLTNTGGLRYHDLETTLRIHRGAKADFSVSYIRSLSHGDLNTLSALYVPFEQPVFRPDFFAELPSNIPNRLVWWGTFQAPFHFTASPILDWHSGFPYSNYTVQENYYGNPDGQRFPTFLSLDLKLAHDFRIPFIPLLNEHKFRLSVDVYNLTNHLNPLDVYSNVASPYFGHFVGFQHRFYDASLDIIY